MAGFRPNSEHIIWFIYGRYVLSINYSIILSDDNMCFENAYKDMDIVTEDLLFGECSACVNGDCSGNDFKNNKFNAKK